MDLSRRVFYKEKHITYNHIQCISIIKKKNQKLKKTKIKKKQKRNTFLLTIIIEL